MEKKTITKYSTEAPYSSTNEEYIVGKFTDFFVNSDPNLCIVQSCSLISVPPGSENIEKDYHTISTSSPFTFTVIKTDKE